MRAPPSAFIYTEARARLQAAVVPLLLICSYFGHQVKVPFNFIERVGIHTRFYTGQWRIQIFKISCGPEEWGAGIMMARLVLTFCSGLYIFVYCIF